MAEEKWVQTWGQSHAPLSFFYYPVKKKTFRIIINTAITGKKVRFGLSNTQGKSDIKIGRVTVAPCNADGVCQSDPVTVKFAGETAFTLYKGQHITSEETDLEVKTGDCFCISAYVVSGKISSGNLLDDAKIIFADGDYSREKICPDERRKRDDVIELSSKLLKMHLARPIPLFDSVELLNNDGAMSVVVFGDSISQQCFWTVPFEKRLRQAYPGKYALINKSVMGNRILRDCSPIFVAKGLYGKRATSRIIDDVYPYQNIKYVVLALGVNDIFEFGSINALPWEKPDIKELFDKIMELKTALQKKGIKVIGFNVPPFGTAPDSTPEKNKMRAEINILFDEHKDEFDGFFDFYSFAVDPDDPDKGTAHLIGGDKLHPNKEGGQKIADMLDINFFK